MINNKYLEAGNIWSTQICYANCKHRVWNLSNTVNAYPAKNLFIGVCYRSSNTNIVGSDNNNRLLEVLDEVSKKHTHHG